MGEVVELPKREPYAFEGRKIRLTHLDYDVWKRRFHAIPDFEAELWTMDGWYAEHLKPNEKWFFRLERHLSNKHQEWLMKAKHGDHPTTQNARKFTGVANTMSVKCTPEELAAYNAQYRCEADEVPGWWLDAYRAGRIK